MDGQIQSLRHQRRDTQIKVFSKWVNTHLIPVNLEVQDLIVDMSDGIRLCWLVELISGQSLGKLNQGKQRFHRMDNVNKCLNFLSQRFPLKGISAEDVVGANPNAILSLLWLIFLHLQMNSNNKEGMNLQDDSQNRESLLKWCQTQTANYPDIKIEDFGQSWKDGLAFNALLHQFRPELVDYEKLNIHSPAYNLNLAFQIAEQQLGVPRLIDVQEFSKENPDQDSILIYVAYLYQTFYKPKRQIPQNTLVDILEKKVTPPLSAAPTPSLRSPKIEEKKEPSWVKKMEEEIIIEQKVVPPLKASPKVKPSPPASINGKSESVPTDNQQLTNHQKGQLIAANVELAIFPDSWECTYCTFMNTPVTKICGICFTRKSEDTVRARKKSGDEVTAAGAPSNGEEDSGEEREWTEDEEILRRPKRESTTSQRISITLESPEALKHLQPSFSSLKDETEVEERVEIARHPEDWDCVHCQFTNPFITKICGSCFTRKNGD